MASNKESSRLVYVEGISLDKALELSNKYCNIIFLTDDHTTSGQSKAVDDINEFEEDTSWNLGLNIVRNGKKYIPILGIHPKYNSINVGDVTYKLKVQKNTGLLALVKDTTKYLYVGYDCNFKEILEDIINNAGNSNYVNKNVRINISSDDLKLYCIKKSKEDNTIIGYLYEYDSLYALQKSIGPLDLIKSSLTENETDETTYFYDSENTENMYAYVYYGHSDAIEITNTYYQKDEDGNISHLNTPFKIATKLDDDSLIINDLKYVKFKILPSDVKALSIHVKN